MKIYFHHILIAVVIVGIFGMPKGAGATPNGGLCYYLSNINAGSIVVAPDSYTQADCGPPKISTQRQWLTDAQIAAGIKPNIGGDTTSFEPLTGESCWFDAGCWVAKAAGSFAAGILLPLAGWLTWLSGTILNFVIKWTVVDMKQNLDVDAVNTVWRTVRDLGNMGFIFVLLYAAITTILGIGKDNKTLIVKIVVVAILINFSLFFTKFIIDISNVLAITLYDAAAHGALTSSEVYDQGGLANSLMKPLGLQTIWNIGFISIDGYTILIAGVMGTVVALIAAFVFLAMAILFVIRFVVLLFVLALSPIAFLSFVLPEMKKYRDQWWGALSGQAFFAPIFFLMMWIVIVISRSILLPLQKGNFTDAIKGQAGSAASAVPDPSAVGLFINYAIVIALLITAMVLAKEWANKAGGGINKLTGWATGVAGGATIGMAGRFSRETLGRAGGAITESEWLKDKAPTSRMARLALATGKKTAGASFDLRGTGLSSKLDAGKAQKGGFAADLKSKVEAEKKYAEETFKPSELMVAQAERELGQAKKTGTPADIAAAQAKLDKISGASEEALRQRKIKELRAGGASKKDAKTAVDKLEDDYLKEVNRLTTGGMSQEDAEKDAQSRGFTAFKSIESLTNTRKGAYAKTVEEQKLKIAFTQKTIPFGLTGRHVLFGPVKKENKLAANAIRKSMKEKKPGEKIAEEIEKQARESSDESGAAPTTPTTSPTTPPITPPPTGGGPATP